MIASCSSSTQRLSLAVEVIEGGSIRVRAPNLALLSRDDCPPSGDKDHSFEATRLVCLDGALARPCVFYYCTISVVPVPAPKFCCRMSRQHGSGQGHRGERQPAPFFWRGEGLAFVQGREEGLPTHTFDPYTCIHARVHKQENPVPTVKTDAVKTMLAACFLALLLAPPHASISCSIVVRDSK